jgi:hypothetical protein
MNSFLNRYTSLPIALDMLSNSHITLLSPETWEDRNDAYYLEQYKAKRKLATVLVVCFSTCRETFHHWKVFSGGSAGVCIEFNRVKLLKSFRGNSSFVTGKVEYCLIGDLKKTQPVPAKWPFLKRIAFRDEEEFRILFRDTTEALRSKAIKIDLGSVQKITLSPWLPRSVATSVVAVIKGLDGCSKMDVRPSSLLDNRGWREAIVHV